MRMLHSEPRSNEILFMGFKSCTKKIIMKSKNNANYDVFLTVFLVFTCSAVIGIKFIVMIKAILHFHDEKK